MGVGRAAHAVYTGAKEFVEHVVLVGGHHQLVNGQAHLARHMAGADVAEVARRHSKTNLLGVAVSKSTKRLFVNGSYW